MTEKTLYTEVSTKVVNKKSIIDISKYIKFCSSIHSLNMALKGSAKLFPSLFSKPRGVTVIGASSKTGKRDKGFLISISQRVGQICSSSNTSSLFVLYILSFS
jgi:hypothetical protein